MYQIFRGITNDGRLILGNTVLNQTCYMFKQKQIKNVARTLLDTICIFKLLYITEESEKNIKEIKILNCISRLLAQLPIEEEK